MIQEFYLTLIYRMSLFIGGKEDAGMIRRKCRNFLRYRVLAIALTQVFLIVIVLSVFHSIENPLQLRKLFDPSTLENRIETSAIPKSWKFRDFKVENWVNQSFNLQHESVIEENKYFRELLIGLECFIEGTDWNKSNSSCYCINGYYGEDCGIPDSIWHGHYSKYPNDLKRLKRRRYPRRIIQGLLVNHEFDFLEIRIASSYDVVDVFIIQESNYTTFGASKSLDFLDRFKDGWLSEYQEKILYVLLHHFEDKGKDNGWFADAYIRAYLSKKSLPLIEDKHDDDLFLLFDADEIPNRDALLFLKLYEGYSEPIRFGFRWTVYGFFWLKPKDPGLLNSLLNTNPQERLLQLYNACTLGMLKDVYGNNAMLMRRNVYKHKSLRKKYSQYSAFHKVKPWDIGTLGHYGGYHCSWCYQAEGIRRKLLSAQKNDNPRWGDYPEKTKLSYIQNLIKTGGWFDGTFPYLRANESDPHYAPMYILNRPKKFGYLLHPPK